MKKMFLVCMIVFFHVSLLCGSFEISTTEFDMFFSKTGVSEVGIKVNDAATSPVGIEFDLWDPNNIKYKEGEIVYPSKNFDVFWNITRGSAYKLTLSFNSSSDQTGDKMLSAIADNGTSIGLNYNAVVDFDDGSTDKSTNITNDSNANDATLILNNPDTNSSENDYTNREPYATVEGTANVTITLIPNNIEEGKVSYPYFVPGTYNGYIFLTLDTIE